MKNLYTLTKASLIIAENSLTRVYVCYDAESDKFDVALEAFENSHSIEFDFEASCIPKKQRVDAAKKFLLGLAKRQEQQKAGRPKKHRTDSLFIRMTSDDKKAILEKFGSVANVRAYLLRKARKTEQ